MSVLISISITGRCTREKILRYTVKVVQMFVPFNIRGSLE